MWLSCVCFRVLVADLLLLFGYSRLSCPRSGIVIKAPAIVSRRKLRKV